MQGILNFKDTMCKKKVILLLCIFTCYTSGRTGHSFLWDESNIVIQLSQHNLPIRGHLPVNTFTWWFQGLGVLFEEIRLYLVYGA